MTDASPIPSPAESDFPRPYVTEGAMMDGVPDSSGLWVQIEADPSHVARERAKAIWRALAGDSFTKCYHFEIAAHLLDEESFQILAEMPKGKVRLEIGLQSTNEKTLAAISRAGDSATVLAAARRLTEAGNLHIHLDLIAGLPFETYASFARGFDEAYFACDVLQLGFLKLLHGTRLRRDADALGIRYSAKAPYTVLKTPDMSFEEAIETIVYWNLQVPDYQRW